MFFNLHAYKDATAIYTENREWCYADLIDLSEKIAEVISKRSLIILLCSNTPASIAGYIGFINHGIVPILMDSAINQEFLVKLIKRYRPSYLWIPANQVKEYPLYKAVLWLEGYVLLDTLEKGRPLLHDDLALLMTTSGSTGSPKLVRQSYANLRVNTDSIVEYLQLNETERSITNLPMNYVYGLSIINTHLVVGASIVVTEKSLFQREFWQLFRDRKVTNFGGVPYTYEMLHKLRFFRMDLPSLRYMTQAGGKLDPELHQKFANYAVEHEKKFIVMYGAAEATSRMGYLPAEQSLHKVGCMGIAIPGGRFELRDDDNSIIEEADTSGELVYYGDNVTMGYAACGEDLSKGDERHGCYETGDIAKRDEDGYYTIVGRKKRFLKMFGKRTNLQEVEHILRQKFGDIDVACAGLDDHLYVFVTDCQFVSDLVPFLSQKLGIHYSAFAVKCINTIPKNVSGKTIYRELEHYYDV